MVYTIFYINRWYMVYAAVRNSSCVSSLLFWGASTTATSTVILVASFLILGVWSGSFSGLVSSGCIHPKSGICFICMQCCASLILVSLHSLNSSAIFTTESIILSPTITLGEYSQYQSKLSSSWLAVRARVFRISGGNSSCSWFSLCTGPICEWGVVDYNAGWEVGWCGELTESSSTFWQIASQCLCRGTHTGRIQTLSFSTVFIVTPWDWSWIANRSKIKN